MLTGLESLRRQQAVAMIKSITWDIWVAAALAVATILAAIFDPAPVAFIVLYLGLCAYVVLETFNGEHK
jgi:hypothetical protein